MKKQIVKALSISVLTLAALFATAPVSANGQTIRPASAQIPFEFIVGATTVSAGEYIVSSANQDGSALLIRNANGHEATIQLTHSIQSRRNKAESRFVFHRYGQTYFLAEVWQAGDSTGWELSPSKAERALQRERASLAQNSYETVELVARNR